MPDQDDSAAPPIPPDTPPAPEIDTRLPAVDIDTQPAVSDYLASEEPVSSDAPPPEIPPIPISDTAPTEPGPEIWPSQGSRAETAVVLGGAAVSGAHHLAVLRAELVAWFKTLFSAAVYATLIVTFGFQVARVEGQSMAPTLADQDRLIVNKLAYRLGPPRRGDIVMLFYPRDPDKSFVKRVIAEEGDTVKIEDGRVFVNDVPMPDDYVLPEYRSHEDEPARVIQPGYYYVMGDHRNNSSDSRSWGEVPKKYIVGRVQLRWWPIPHARLF
jgi:signal peptidase I